MEPHLAALLGSPSSSPPRLRNFARDRFPVGAGPARLALWPVTEVDRDATDAAIVSDLRRPTGRFPHEHPAVGPITVDCDVLTDGDSDLKIVIMTAVPGSEDETKLRLATIAGQPVTTHR